MSTGASHSLILGTNLVSFLPGVSPEERSRTLDCLLYAELHNARSADRKIDWERWINTYQQALSSAGFKRTAILNRGPVTVSNRKGFQREATKIVNAIESRDLTSAAQTALDILFKSPAAQRFFSDWLNFSSSRSDCFQIIPCRKSSSGRIEIAVCGMQMTTRTKPRIFSAIPWPVDYEMTLSLRGGNFNFDSATYLGNKVRIEQELQEGGSRYLEQITL